MKLDNGEVFDADDSEARLPSTAIEPVMTSLDAFRNIDKEAAELKAQHENASHEDIVCADWARSEIRSAKSSALATKSIFTYCFVAPDHSALRSIYACVMLALAITIQVAVPSIILITRQPVSDLSNACPRQSSYQTKIVGFALSMYFVTQTVSLCINKLRGLGFLYR